MPKMDEEVRDIELDLMMAKFWNSKNEYHKLQNEMIRLKYKIQECIEIYNLDKKKVLEKLDSMRDEVLNHYRAFYFDSSLNGHPDNKHEMNKALEFTTLVLASRIKEEELEE